MFFPVPAGPIPKTIIFFTDIIYIILLPECFRLNRLSLYGMTDHIFINLYHLRPFVFLQKSKCVVYILFADNISPFCKLIQLFKHFLCAACGRWSTDNFQLIIAYNNRYTLVFVLFFDIGIKLSEDICHMFRWYPERYFIQTHLQVPLVSFLVGTKVVIFHTPLPDHRYDSFYLSVQS